MTKADSKTEPKVKLRIKSILKEKGMTAKSLADKMGKTPQYLNTVINGDKGASLNSLQKIAEALNVPVATLLADYEQAINPTIICPKCGARIVLDSKIEVHEENPE